MAFDNAGCADPLNIFNPSFMCAQSIKKAGQINRHRKKEDGPVSAFKRSRW